MPTEDKNPGGSRGKETRMPARRSEAEVLRLLMVYKETGDIQIRGMLVQQYTNLVESVARRFSGGFEPVEDLAQEGYIGLISAIEMYDPARNVKFSTYATHFIIGQIKHYLRDKGKIIKEPAWLQELNQRMTRATETLSQQLHRTPTCEEIAQTMGMTEEAVSELMMNREVFKVTSLDGGTDTDDDSNSVDIDRSLPKEASIRFEMPLEDRVVLESAIGKLKSLEQQVLMEFYFHDLNQTEIARMLGISGNYVSHLLRNATKKLKKILTIEEAREGWEMAASVRQQVEDKLFPDPAGIVDDLTRLYNRSYFEMRLEEELRRASRMNEEVAMLFVHLGGLQEFTRLGGTLRADEAVRGTANMLRTGVRRYDIVTRYAADSFALILPGTGTHVHTVRTRLEARLSEWLQQQGWNKGQCPLWYSFGCAHYPQQSQSGMLLESAHNMLASSLKALKKAA